MIRMVRIGSKRELAYADISEVIIGCCFEVMKERGLTVLVEQSFDVIFRNRKIGKYIADLIVENLIVVELKCCKTLLSEHQAQVINYLKASQLPVGFLLNFGNQKLEYKRLHHPDKFTETEEPEGRLTAS